MTDHLQDATPPVKVRVDELGGNELVAVLDDLVAGNEEFVVNWVDAQDDEFEADEVSDWSVVDVVTFGAAVVYVELSLEIFGLTEGDEHMHHRGIHAFARVLVGPPMATDRFDLEPVDLRSWIASDAANESGIDPSCEEGFRVGVAAYLENVGPHGKPPAHTVMLRETERGIEVYGLPGADADETDKPRVPATDLIATPVSDSAGYLDREPPTNERTDDLHEVLELFASEGLGQPPIPLVLRNSIRKRDRWCYASRGIEPGLMYASQEYLIEVVSADVDNYVAVFHAGHGVNSYAVSYHLVYGRLALFAQTPWGGAYGDAVTDSAQVAAQLARCAALIETYEGRAAADLLPPPPARLIVVESKFRGVGICRWLPRPICDGDAAAEWLQASNDLACVPTIAAHELLKRPDGAT